MNRVLKIVSVAIVTLLFMGFGAQTHARAFFPSIGAVKGVSTLRVPVLLYHYVRPPPTDDPLGVKLSIDPAQFQKQLSFLLQNGYTPISPDLLYAALQSRVTLPKNPVLLTFDDGTEDFASTVFPLLTLYGVPATVYVIPAFVGTKGYMTWEELRDVSASPLVTIGGHGLNHAPLTSLPKDVARRQIILTKNVLSTVTGQPVRTFAYPNGQFNNDIARMAGEAGYTTAFTAAKGLDQSFDSRFTLPRLHAGNSLSSLQRVLVR